MYKRFFGFKERPFKLVPDPAYLYLSRTHEEAMAHLTYAVSQGDGFVEITGEVGTGKTTLCRAFLESLDTSTEAAYIFNPKLDSIQLLKAINDEFGIASDARSTKALIDTLNEFLIEKKTGGKQVVLVVDEAQNLSKEVLEQLRLLSNLETTKDKLLQIVLVGQPELGEILDSYELRQLGQRITLSCHLAPLSFKETREYIQHRINISSQRPGMRFDNAALRSIYKFSRGLPRLINIICDRSLLTAFGLNRHRITGNIVRISARELSRKVKLKTGTMLEGRAGVVILSLLCITLSMIVLDRLDLFSINAKLKRSGPESGRSLPPGLSEKPAMTRAIPVQSPPVASRAPATRQDMAECPPEPVIVSAAPNEREKDGETDVSGPEPKIEPDAKPETELKTEPDAKPDTKPETKPKIGSFSGLMDFLKSAEPRASRSAALSGAMMRWNGDIEIKPYLDGINRVDVFFRLAAKQNGLSLHRIQSDLYTIYNLNLPSVLELHPPGRQTRIYLSVVKMDNEKITLTGGKENVLITVTREELSPVWSGVAFIPWKNFMSFDGTVPLNVTGEDILALKMHLRDIGFDDIDLTQVYDKKAEGAVRSIQEKHGISIDGFVGPLTKIILYNEKRSLKIPHLHE